jgi:hypothetical protein
VAMNHADFIITSTYQEIAGERGSHCDDGAAATSELRGSVLLVRRLQGAAVMPGRQVVAVDHQPLDGALGAI